MYGKKKKKKKKKVMAEHPVQRENIKHTHTQKAGKEEPSEKPD